MEICHGFPTDFQWISNGFPMDFLGAPGCGKETLAPEASAVSETEMRYAPAGYKFAVPLKEILTLCTSWYPLVI